MKKGRGQAQSLPLCVDLDGTLVKTDLLIEALLQLAHENFLALFLVPLWLLKGKASFKQEVFARVDLPVDSLPYHEELLDYLKKEHAAGREIHLATASSAKVAEKVAAHLGIFTQVLGSSTAVNLAGRKKAEALVERFGAKQFAYAANAPVDLDVWREAGEAHVVDATTGLTKRVEAVCRVEGVYERKRNRAKLVLKAMRVHQWAKNALIFAPLVLSHQASNYKLFLICLGAFCAFSMVSSSVYLINDLLDLDSDRKHPDKRRRPFAAGALPVTWGLGLAPLLFVGGMVTAYFLGAKFLWVLAAYFVVTSAYSFHLKQVVLADVLILAFLYAWRVFAGSAATGIGLSKWALAFFGFFFLSLALVKRCSELLLTMKNGNAANKRRGYWVQDLNQLISFGSSSGYIAVLVLALYINSEQVTSAYVYPQYLWLVCPVLLYWISRVWLKAHRGLMHSDPLVFALKDRVSYIMVAVMAAIWVVASGGL